MARPGYDLKYREDAEAYEHEDQLEADTIEWLKTFYSGDERLMKAYNKMKISEYTSRCHRNGISYERMLIISKTYIIFAIVDDFIDNNPIFYDKVTTLMLDIMRNNRIVTIDHTEPENYLLSAWSEVWQEIISCSPKHWQEQLTFSLQYWFTSTMIENTVRDSKRLPSYNEYHSLRLISIFVEICLDFMEFAQNEYLAMEDRANSTFKLLYIHAKTVVYLTNDLYSWPKEKRVGDSINIIYLHQQLSKLSEDDAISAVVKKINEELDAMYFIMDNYRSVMSPGVEFYLPMLARFVRGNYDFHLNSRRYDLALY